MGLEGLLIPEKNEPGRGTFTEQPCGNWPGVFWVSGENGSPKLPSDQLLNLFGSDSSVLFNFSQADHVYVFQKLINSTMEHLLSAWCWRYEGTEGTEITALVEHTLFGGDKKQVKQNARHVIG